MSGLWEFENHFYEVLVLFFPGFIPHYLKVAS
jgi:hypothetical protein